MGLDSLSPDCSPAVPAAYALTQWGVPAGLGPSGIVHLGPSIEGLHSSVPGNCHKFNWF